MAPRYQTNKGYNKYNKGKLFEEDQLPYGRPYQATSGQGGLSIINNDFLNQNKRKIDLIGPGAVQPEYIKPKHGSSEFHKQNEIGLEKAYNSPNYLYKDNDTL